MAKILPRTRLIISLYYVVCLCNICPDARQHSRRPISIPHAAYLCWYAINSIRLSLLLVFLTRHQYFFYCQSEGPVLERKTN